MIASSLGVLILVAVAVVHVTCITPNFDVTKRLEAKLRDAVKELEENSRRRREVEQTEQRNKEIRARLAVFDRRVPPRGEVPALFADVLQLADSSELKISQAQPRDVVPLGQGLFRFPYELDLEGDYAALRLFLSRIESHASLMQVPRVEIEGTGQSGRVRIRLFLQLYGSLSMADKEPPPAES